MKVLVTVKNVRIELDSEFDDPQMIEGIKQVLEALCWTIRGVDLAGQWPLFDKAVHATAKVLKEKLLKEEGR